MLQGREKRGLMRVLKKYSPATTVVSGVFCIKHFDFPKGTLINPGREILVSGC